jgi:5,10-methylene-tetrahydrofolate dehydrogenase/methenyl tetrahydrofolate cyclohydrolase
VRQTVVAGIADDERDAQATAKAKAVERLSSTTTPSSASTRAWDATRMHQLAKTIHAPLSGLEALVIGSSTIVGKPLAQLPHRRERDRNFGAFQDRNLPAVCRWADLLFTALGHPEFVRGDWII